MVNEVLDMTDWSTELGGNYITHVMIMPMLACWKERKYIYIALDEFEDIGLCNDLSIEGSCCVHG